MKKNIANRTTNIRLVRAIGCLMRVEDNVLLSVGDAGYCLPEIARVCRDIEKERQELSRLVIFFGSGGFKLPHEAKPIRNDNRRAIRAVVDAVCGKSAGGR
jgi:hypothetical protein